MADLKNLGAALAFAAIITGPAWAGGKQEAAMETSVPAVSGGETAMAVPPPGTMGEYRKPQEAQLMKTLTPMQFDVTQREGTEPPFMNEYWDNHRDGIYVDVVSGEPLFSSIDKYESGTGWPSFTRPLVAGNVVTKTDKAFGMVRTEVRSRYAGSHLGHVFDDGPKPTGLRYCMNSAALRFVPVDQLESQGYGEYAGLFRK